MIKIYLIRHGQAEDGWTSLDPGLSKTGEKQSKDLSKKINRIITGKERFVSSPLKRCLETANISLAGNDFNVEIDKTFAELPSPISDFNKRVVWLKRVLPLTWEELENDPISASSCISYSIWREDVIRSLLKLKGDSIIFSHYVVINSVIGWALNSNKVVNFNPANCSITELEINKGKISILSLGDENLSKVNI